SYRIPSMPAKTPCKKMEASLNSSLRPWSLFSSSCYAVYYQGNDKELVFSTDSL
ncbi:hypothetical protein S83_070155, partial [Arachis hypogaea]